MYAERIVKESDSETQIFSAIILIQYVLSSWKEAKIIMMAKPGKSLTDLRSYRPISLLTSIQIV